MIVKKYKLIFLFVKLIVINSLFLLFCEGEKITNQEPVEVEQKYLLTNSGTKLIKVNINNGKILWHRGDYNFQKHIFAFDSSKGDSWIADLNSDQHNSTLYKFNHSGDELLKMRGFGKIKGISVNSNDGNCAIIDSVNIDKFQLKVLDKNGNQMFEVESLNGLPFYNVDDNSIWISGRDNLSDHKINVYSSSGNLIKQFSGINSCIDMSFDVKRRLVWLAMSGFPSAINVIDYEGNLVFEKTVGGLKGFDNIRSIAVDVQDGSCWVADSGNDRIVKVFQDNEDIIDISNVEFCNAITIDLKTRDCFIAATELNKIIRVNANGSFRGVLTSIEKPMDLCLCQD